MKFRLYEGRRIVPHTKAEMGVLKKEPEVQPEVQPEPRVESETEIYRSDPTVIAFHISVGLHKNNVEYDTFYEANCLWDTKTQKGSLSEVHFTNEWDELLNPQVVDFKLAYITFFLTDISGFATTDFWFKGMSDYDVWISGNLRNYPDTTFYPEGTAQIFKSRTYDLVGNFAISDFTTHVGYLPLNLTPADISDIIKILIFPRLPKILTRYKSNAPVN